MPRPAVDGLIYSQHCFPGWSDFNNMSFLPQNIEAYCHLAALGRAANQVKESAIVLGVVFPDDLIGTST